MDKKIIMGIAALIIVGVFFISINKSPTGNVIAQPIDEGDVIKIPLSAVSNKA